MLEIWQSRPFELTVYNAHTAAAETAPVNINFRSTKGCQFLDKICIKQIYNFPILLISTSDARVNILLCCEEIK